MIDAGRSAPRLLRGRRRPRGRSRDGRRVGFPRPRVTPKRLLGLLAAAVVFGGGWLWFRDSSFVTVQRVAVTGVRGPDAGQIRRALASAALNMTTLDVSIGTLRSAVARYPVVKDLQVSTSFPHAIRIHVVEELPVASVLVGGQPVAVAGDGALLHGVAGAAALPRVALHVPLDGTRLAGTALDEVSVLAAAPYQMLPQISQVTASARHGLTAQLRKGPSIYFGDGGELGAKWTAAVAVLGDPRSDGALYIDVSDPHLPAAGGATPAAGGAGGSQAGGAGGFQAAGAGGSQAGGAGGSQAAGAGGSQAGATGATPTTGQPGG